MEKQDGVAKAWCFTINNPKVTDEVLEDRLERLGVDYCVFQHEVGESGTHHIQGYMELKKGKRMTAIKKAIVNEMHLEKRKGTREEAREYCMKAESRQYDDVPPREVGVWESAKQGKRTDLQSALAALKDGRGIKRVAEEFPEVYVKYHRGLEKLAMMDMMEREEAPEVEVYYGPSGCGKTRLARKIDGEETRWMNPVGDGNWFDGYAGEDVAILDDFDGKFSGARLRDFLRVTDRYAIRVPIKGGFVMWQPRVIRITTNIHPKDWWDYARRGEQFRAIERRVARVYHWRRDGGPILVDRNGRPGLWKTWWEGPFEGQRLDVPRMGPMDDWVEVEGGELRDQFNFIVEDNE